MLGVQEFEQPFRVLEELKAIKLNMLHHNYSEGLEHGLHLIVYVLGSEAELLVKHLLRSGETEAFKAEHLAVAAHKSLKIHRETCCEAEYLGAVRKDGVLIFCRLAAEESL